MVDKHFVNWMDQITDNVWLGDVRAASDPLLLEKHKITHLLSMGVKPTMVKDKIIKMFVNIEDEVDPILPHLDPCVNFMCQAIKENGIILVHW